MKPAAHKMEKFEANKEYCIESEKENEAALGENAILTLHNA